MTLQQTLEFFTQLNPQKNFSNKPISYGILQIKGAKIQGIHAGIHCEPFLQRSFNVSHFYEGLPVITSHLL